MCGRWAGVSDRSGRCCSRGSCLFCGARCISTPSPPPTTNNKQNNINNLLQLGCCCGGCWRPERRRARPPVSACGVSVPALAALRRANVVPCPHPARPLSHPHSVPLSSPPDLFLPQSKAPHIQALGPVKAELKAGQDYYFCTCGRSTTGLCQGLVCSGRVLSTWCAWLWLAHLGFRELFASPSPLICSCPNHVLDSTLGNRPYSTRAHRSRRKSSRWVWWGGVQSQLRDTHKGTATAHSVAHLRSNTPRLRRTAHTTCASASRAASSFSVTYAAPRSPPFFCRHPSFLTPRPVAHTPGLARQAGRAQGLQQAAPAGQLFPDQGGERQCWKANSIARMV